MTPLKAQVLTVFCIGFATLVAFAFWANGARQKAEAGVRQAAACEKAVGRGAMVPADLTSCTPQISRVAQEAGAARACDAALRGLSAAFRASCSGPVKTLVAERDVALGEKAALSAQLTAERSAQTAALGRAVQAATQTAERKARAQAALDAAPRDGDGLTVCAADCLRDAWGQASQPARP